MKKLLPILCILMSLTAFADNVKTIINNVDLTAVLNEYQNLKANESLNYIKTNADKLKQQFNELDLINKAYYRDNLYAKNGTIIPHKYINLIAQYYCDIDKSIISQENALRLFAATYLSRNPELYQKWANDGYSNEYVHGQRVWAILLNNDANGMKLFKADFLAAPSLICDFYKNFKKVFTDEEIFESLSNADNLTDEQKKFKNDLFVKLYQKKMLGK